MKQIELKEITIDGPGGGKINYQEQILQALRTPLNPQGADFAEMAAVLPLINKFKDATPEKGVLLENDEHELLVKYMKSARYSVTHEAIYDMVNEVANVEDVAVEVVKDGAAN